MEDVKFDAVLFMDDPQFAEKLVAIIGASPGETIEIHTPQFEREDGIKPASNPEELFASMRTLSAEALTAIGMRQWGEYGLWLMPYQWYDHIPDGYLLTCIDGKEAPFKRGVTDDDRRFGVLAYGIVPDFEKSA